MCVCVCVSVYVLASFPDSSRFSNVARRKRREPGKIYHVSDVGWRGLAQAARARSYASTWVFCRQSERGDSWMKKEERTYGPDSM